MGAVTSKDVGCSDVGVLFTSTNGDNENKLAVREGYSANGSEK